MVIEKRNGKKTIKYTERQTALLRAGIDPVEVQELRRQLIAMLRVTDSLLFDDKGFTIPERQR